MKLLVRIVSPVHVGGAVQTPGPLDLLPDGDWLSHVDLDQFVRRLGLAERAAFESRLLARDGLREGHLFIADRQPLCRPDAVAVGLLSPAVRSALADFRRGAQRGFKLAHAPQRRAGAVPFDGGHVRAALVAGVTDRRVARTSPGATRPWSGVALGPVQIVSGALESHVALLGRLAPAAARPLVVASRENWLQVHVGTDDLLMSLDLPRRDDRSEDWLDAHWANLVEAQPPVLDDMRRQVQALERQPEADLGPQATAFLTRARSGLALCNGGGACLLRLGMGGGPRPAPPPGAPVRPSATTPAAVFSQRDGTAPGRRRDHVPLGWISVQREPSGS